MTNRRFIWSSLGKIVYGSLITATFCLAVYSELPADTSATHQPVETAGDASAKSLYSRPNIVLILADDMGYGDIAAYNQSSKIPTPNLDSLAESGMRFTDAHSPSAVCTPTRYGLLTGRYAWRSELKRGVLWGHSPLLIETGRETIASMLKRIGYTTAAIGKWHLGIGNNEANYYGRLAPGPNSVGFDYFYGIPASLDMEPYVYVENEQLDTPLEGRIIKASDKRREGGGGFWRSGQIGTGFSHQEVLPVLADKATEYIRQHGEDSNQEPFFLYFALPSPHTPWLPAEEYQGISGAGYYGDFAAQVDGVVGRVVKALEESGLATNTLLVYTSDNGAHWFDTDIGQFGHRANGTLRGQKADIYEGGHRVPLMVLWPGKVAGGTVSQQPVVLTDLMATFASITGAEVAQQAAPDSVDFSPVLLSEDDARIQRLPMVHHSMNGMFAIRAGNWKLIEGLGSGGFTKPSRIEATGQEMPYQLYDLANDLAETSNVAGEHPEVVKALLAELNLIRDSESSKHLEGFARKYEDQP